MSNRKLLEVQRFYDQYWPTNIPDAQKTRGHISSILPEDNFNYILDAGCGSGVCLMGLSEKANMVYGVDLSFNCVKLSKVAAQKQKKDNTKLSQANILSLPFKDETFDVVFSWGVIHHTPDPIKALDELTRVLRKGGIIILAVYTRTKLTFLHEWIRAFCLKSPKLFKKPFIKGVSSFVRIMERLGKNTQPRDDTWIEAQAEDWFFVPEKHFFTIEEMKVYFARLGLKFNLLYEQTGRFRSSSNFIVRGTKLK